MPPLYGQKQLGIGAARDARPFCVYLSLRFSAYLTTRITTALRLVLPEVAVTVMLNVPEGVLPGGP
jgi:hypothetical protein